MLQVLQMLHPGDFRAWDKGPKRFPKTFPRLRIIGKLVEKRPIIFFPTFADVKS
jgi:hypothetical protein